MIQTSSRNCRIGDGLRARQRVVGLVEIPRPLSSPRLRSRSQRRCLSACHSHPSGSLEPGKASRHFMCRQAARHQNVRVRRARSQEDRAGAKAPIGEPIRSISSVGSPRSRPWVPTRPQHSNGGRWSSDRSTEQRRTIPSMRRKDRRFRLDDVDDGGADDRSMRNRDGGESSGRGRARASHVSHAFEMTCGIRLLASAARKPRI